MHVTQHTETPPTADWAEQTRRVLTRDLLLRARRSPLGEARALEFRALHLNLPLIREVSDRLPVVEEQRARRARGLEGLAEAVRQHDRSTRPADFAEVAAAVGRGPDEAPGAAATPDRAVHLRQTSTGCTGQGRARAPDVRPVLSPRTAGPSPR